MNAPSLHRLVAAYRNSQNGLRFLFRSEAAFKDEVLLGIPTLGLAVFLTIPALFRLLLLLSYLALLSVEILNTAIEKTVDRIGTEHHPLSGLIKDLGSAAVLVSFLAYLLCVAFAIHAHLQYV
jgi:diacylglycerol kinase (ATP)